MKIKVNNPDEYISSLPTERQIPIQKLREAVRENIPDGFQEGIGYGMIAYYVPKSLYPSGYHCNPELPLPFINIASQKNFISIYHMGIYANPLLSKWFIENYPMHCKSKLDMGKSCIRFKKLDDIPYDLIKELVKKTSVKEWITMYEENLKSVK